MEQSVSNSYESTWNRFVKELKTNPKTTLRSVCRRTHTDPNLMRAWASRHGHSVLKAKAEHSMKKLENTSSSNFAIIVPKDTPSVYNESSLLGISITFNSGTTINIKQGDTDGIIRLIRLYERKDGDSCTL